MQVKELIRMVNEEGKSIYDISESEGFSRGTLRQRLIKFGYKFDDESKKWFYTGTNEIEPLDYEICYPSKSKQQPTANLKNSIGAESTDFFTALLQLPLESNKVTNSFKTDKALVDRMKKFIEQVSLPVGKIYSLAVYEFLEKYEPILKELKNSKK